MVLFICFGIITLKIVIVTEIVVYLKQCNLRTLEVPYTDLSLGQFFVDTLFAFGEQRFITKKTSFFVMTHFAFV